MRPLRHPLRVALACLAALAGPCGLAGGYALGRRRTEADVARQEAAARHRDGACLAARWACAPRRTPRAAGPLELPLTDRPVPSPCPVAHPPRSTAALTARRNPHP